MNRKTGRGATSHSCKIQGVMKDGHRESIEEFPSLMEGQTASNISQSRGGVFKRLRRRLASSIARQLPTGSSSVSAINTVPSEVRRNDTIVVRMERAPHYQSVPLPPGCFPSEVMMIAENQHQSSSFGQLGQMTAEMDGFQQKQEEHQHQRVKFQENEGIEGIASNVQCGKPSMYNNWVSPNF